LKKLKKFMFFLVLSPCVGRGTYTRSAKPSILWMGQMGKILEEGE